MGERRIELVPNRTIWFKSADSPDSLRSKGLDYAWVDEAGLISEEAWNFLRPALMDRHGIAWFTGTPKGKNLFFRLWQRGQDPLESEFKSWTFPSNANPRLPNVEIEAFRAEMPDAVYQQEINALFMENVGTVFRKVRDHVKTDIPPYKAGEETYIGCDLGKHVDFTVLIALRANGECVGFDRFGQLDWVLQRRRITDFARRFNGRILLDSSGLGDPVYDELSREYEKLDGYKFTEPSKKDLIENLTIGLDNNEVWLPDNQLLLSELEIFGYEMTKSGGTKYHAPEGYHDDCVIALALARWQVKNFSGREDVKAKFLPFRR
jgi:hypothetical protein